MVRSFCYICEGVGRVGGLMRRLIETVDMIPGGVMLNTQKGQWRSLECLGARMVLRKSKVGGVSDVG